MASTDTTTALTTIIGVLTPLTSEERHRTVDAAMLFLGERANAARLPPTGDSIDSGHDPRNGAYPARVDAWMRKYGVSGDELDQVFHFKDDGSFEIHDVPGKSMKERTLNTYVLAGAGKFLTTNEREFDDATARRFCERLGCYDQANHATYLKAKHPEFSGDKNKDYSLTNPGFKRAADLVKELAGTAK